jgi:selenocysteine lyase/cysteine desulfurase
MLDLKSSYLRSLQPGRLHFAAHSRHLRPDVTFDATVECLNDGFNMADGVWKHIFGSVIPTAQKNVARLLHVKRPENIAFSANTHEFVARILSSLDPDKPVRILTTGNEFRSFSRQLHRFAERRNVYVTEIPVFPHENFVSLFVEFAQEHTFDLIFFSQVFFDSGFRIAQDQIEKIVASVHSDTTIVIDGYHGFCAVPTSLENVEDRVFYLAGGYKYAQWGEGACFLYVPPHCKLRPENTGWFAEFGDLSNARGGRTKYSDDAFRFWGSTFDSAGLYRLNAVCEWMREKAITLDEIRAHVRNLQSQFLDGLAIRGSRLFSRENLESPLQCYSRGNFLSFHLTKTENAVCAVNALHDHGVIVDSRGPLLRIGFGTYHDSQDVESLLEIISTMKGDDHA